MARLVGPMLMPFGHNYNCQPSLIRGGLHHVNQLHFRRSIRSNAPFPPRGVLPPPRAFSGTHPHHLQFLRNSTAARIACQWQTYDLESGCPPSQLPFHSCQHQRLGSSVVRSGYLWWWLDTHCIFRSRQSVARH